MDLEIVHKTSLAPMAAGDTLEFVMSDGSVDRMGDVIEPAGWQLGNFKKNPIALFGHSSGFPIGSWKNVRVEDDQLRGRLELMPPVSSRLQEIHAAVDAGVLRAVSVGFRPLPGGVEQLEGSKVGGLRFTKHELVECSLVAVPANPNALQVAKSLNLSPEIMSLIFGVPADRGRGGNPLGVPAELNMPRHRSMNLSERIQSGQVELNGLRDQLRTMDIDDTEKTTELTARIEQVCEQLEVWERAERALGNDSDPVVTVPASRTTVLPPGSNLPATTASRTGSNLPGRTAAGIWTAPKRKEEEPGYLFIRHCVGVALAHVTKKPLDQVMQERYGHYPDFQVTKEIHEWYVRAATAPATTTTVGWAAELAQTQYGEFFEALLPGGIYGPLAPRGFRATLGRYAQISMPTRQATPTVAGSFVGEGAPIPVRQAAFTAVTLGLKKMAVIVSYTREIAEHSTPQIESIIRQLIQDDTQIAVDTVLIDANAATAIRPAGLRNGVSATTATAGGGFAALVGDIKGLISVLAAANSLRSPVWIMNPVQGVAISLTQNAGGDFPFKAEINGKTLQGYPVILSSTVPLGMVILLDAADFMSVTGDDPRFDVSDQATLHFEDTNPQAIGLSGSPTAPVRSLFQTDSLALRMILPMNWGMRRTGVVAWTQAVTW